MILPKGTKTSGQGYTLQYALQLAGDGGKNKWAIGGGLTKQIMMYLNKGMFCALTRNDTHLYVLKQADLQTN